MSTTTEGEGSKVNKGSGTNIQSFGDELESGSLPQIREVSPFDRLQFAKWVLRGIFVFFIISISVGLYNQYCGEALFEICRTGLLPIASFVIGDYFGSRGK